MSRSSVSDGFGMATGCLLAFTMFSIVSVGGCIVATGGCAMVVSQAARDIEAQQSQEDDHYYDYPEEVEALQSSEPTPVDDANAP